MIPWWLSGKEPTCNGGGKGSIPGLERSPGGGSVHTLKYSCLEKFHGQRSLVGYSPWGHKESDTTEHTHIPKGIDSDCKCSVIKVHSTPKQAFSFLQNSDYWRIPFSHSSIVFYIPDSHRDAKLLLKSNVFSPHSLLFWFLPYYLSLFVLFILHALTTKMPSEGEFNYMM